MLPAEEWQKLFAEKLDKDPQIAHGKAVYEIILVWMKTDDSTTFQEFVEKMMFVRDSLSASPLADISVGPGGKSFTSTLTRRTHEIEAPPDMNDLRKIVLKRAENLIDRCNIMAKNVGKSASDLFYSFLKFETITVLVHGKDHCVFECLRHVKSQGYNLKVLVLEGQPLCYGREMVKDLRAINIDADLLLDGQAAEAMATAVFVLLGVSAILLNGAIIGRTGTSSLAACAYVCKVPLYVLAETIKLIDVRVLDVSTMRRHQKQHPVKDNPLLETVPSHDFIPDKFVERYYCEYGELHRHYIPEVFDAMNI